MVQIDVTKLSSKGQVVIPLDMRKGFEVGEKLIVIREGDTILLKKAGKLDENFKEDLEFARRTEEAYKRIEVGEYISVDSENLFEEMMKW